jgi:hypothetical protein
MIKLFESLDALKQSGYIFRITDNGGETADRFTITFSDGDYFTSSTNPYHPQGVGLTGEGIDVQRQADRVEAGTDRDLRWIDLPEVVRECVFNLCNEGFADYIEAAPAAETRDEARNWEGQWNSYGDDRTPIYKEGDAFFIRDDERDFIDDDKVAAGPFATFADAVRYMLPQDYDLSGPEYHTTVDLWDESGGPAPLWDCDEEPPHPYEVSMVALDDSTSPHWIEVGRSSRRGPRTGASRRMARG